jgi:hypothetical protein
MKLQDGSQKQQAVKDKEKIDLSAFIKWMKQHLNV